MFDWPMLTLSGLPAGQTVMILIAIGANLPGRHASPLEACRAALAALATDGLLGPPAISSWYDTVPVPFRTQPNYVNAVAAFRCRNMSEKLRGDRMPALLLAYLHEVEQRFGRKRGEANASRTLDLDIVAIGDQVRESPDPVLPHPRAHLRRFVLEPLRDVAPDWRHPVLGLGGGELLAKQPQGGTRRLPPG